MGNSSSSSSVPGKTNLPGKTKLKKAVKFVTVGDPMVGKSCLQLSHTIQFPENYEPTVFDNYSTTVNVKGELVRVELFDTAGKEDYDRLRPLSYPNTDVFIVAYSVIDHVSLENVKQKWVPEIRKFMKDGICGGTPKLLDVPILLVGTKTDLRRDNDTLHVRSIDGQNMAHELCLQAFVECSSLTQEGLTNTFREATRLGADPSHRSDLFNFARVRDALNLGLMLSCDKFGTPIKTKGLMKTQFPFRRASFFRTRGIEKEKENADVVLENSLGRLIKSIHEPAWRLIRDFLLNPYELACARQNFLAGTLVTTPRVEMFHTVTHRLLHAAHSEEEK
jgi:small GTP-binding protein